jgi:ATP phosphoribosyltransferase regulatory subunit
LIHSLHETGLESFQLSVGHIGFVKEFFTDILGTEERVNALTTFLYEKNYVGYREHVKRLTLSSIDKQRLIDFLSLRGGEEVIEAASHLLENDKGKKALVELKQLWETLSDYGESGKRVKFDLTLVSHMTYYTGIVFEVYADHVGFPIASGGRYDLLLQKFGKEAGATGFAIRLDRLLEALGKIEAREPVQCILFSAERRKEAFLLASDKRNEGIKVVLQDINGVNNLDACSELYEDVTLLVGKAGKESAQ